MVDEDAISSVIFHNLFDYLSSVSKDLGISLPISVRIIAEIIQLGYVGILFHRMYYEVFFFRPMFFHIIRG